jgi:hypothetical protein
MANGTPNQQLQGLLTRLQTALNNLATQTGGSSAYYQTYYQDVYNAITGSPQLLAQFNSAASSSTTPLAGFTLGASGGAIQFNPSSNTVQLPATYLTTLVGVGFTSTQAIVNDLTNVLGHEISHEANNANVQQQISLLNTSLQQTISNWDGSGPIDLTTYAESVVNVHLVDEANANLQGWNDEISAAVAANGGAALSMTQIAGLIGSSGHAGQLFNLSATKVAGVPVTWSGVTMDESGSVDDTTANVQAVAAIMGLHSPSNAGSDTYYQYYDASAIGNICTAIAGLPFQFSLDYNALNLTIPATSVSQAQPLTDSQVDAALIAGAAGAIGGLPLGSLGSCQIINSADGSINTFTQGPKGVTATATPPPSPEDDPVGSAGPTLASINGTLSAGEWEVATSQPTSGTVSSVVFGQGVIRPALLWQDKAIRSTRARTIASL